MPVELGDKTYIALSFSTTTSGSNALICLGKRNHDGGMSLVARTFRASSVNTSGFITRFLACCRRSQSKLWNSSSASLRTRTEDRYREIRGPYFERAQTYKARSLERYGALKL